MKRPTMRNSIHCGPTKHHIHFCVNAGVPPHAFIPLCKICVARSLEGCLPKQTATL